MPKNYSDLSEKEWFKIYRKFLHSSGIKRRAEIMEEVHNICAAAGLRHWLAMSALLGIYRDGHLLKRDEDVDFYCFSHELIPIIDMLSEKFMDAGYSVRCYRDKGRLLVFKDGEEAALMGHRTKGGKAYFKKRSIPVTYFSDTKIEYNGVVYPCMGPTGGSGYSYGIEKYLTWHYCNWKKPYYGNPEDRDNYMRKHK